MHLPTTMHPPSAPQQQQQQQQPPPPQQPQSQQQPTTQHHHPQHQQQQQQQQQNFHPQQTPSTQHQQHHNSQPNQQQHHHHQALPPTTHHNPLHHHPDTTNPHTQHHHATHHPSHIAHPHPGASQHQHHLNQHQQQAHMHPPQRQQQYLQTHIDHQNHQQPHPQHQHHHHHQHHPAQGQHQMRPPQAHHHISHAHGHSMMLSPPQYPGVMYAPINSHFVPQAGVPPTFNHVPNLNYRMDHINLGSQNQPQNQAPNQAQTQTQTQQQAQQPLQQAQQPPQQQAGSINPNNITQRVPQVPPSVVSTSAPSNTSVQQLTNGPVLDPHMHARLSMNPPYLVPGQYINHIQMMHYPVGGAYPGGHLPPPNPPMLPPRSPTGLGMRLPPTLEPHNHVTSLPRPPVVVAPKPAVPVPAGPVMAPIPSAAPPTTMKPRVRKALAIVDPETRHVYTEAELKSFPSSSSETPASNTNPASSSSTTTEASDSSPAIPTDPKTTSAESEQKATKIDLQPTTTTDTTSATNASIADPKVPTPTQSTSNLDSSINTERLSKLEKPASDSSSLPAKAHSQKESTRAPTIQPPQQKPSSVNDKIEIVELVDKLSILGPPKSTPATTVQTGETTKNNVRCPTNHMLVDTAEQKNVNDTVDNGTISGVDKAAEPVASTECSDKKLDPKLPYEDDQYSPSNPQGRKKYSIKFLKAVCIAMGDDYAPNPVDHPMKDLFKPSYVNDNNFYHNYRDAGQMSRRASQQMINKPPRKIIATHSLQPDVELKTVENPWRPELEAAKAKAIDSEQMDTKRLLKVFRGHLNRLTPQKYDSIIEKVAELDLTDHLESVIDLVFDKAVDEPGFCALYARMCKVIAAKDPKFCFHLVKKCQNEFETADLYDGLNVEERTNTIENETDSTKKKMLEDELYEDMRIRRRKYLGTIKLLGEMYKLNLLNAKIIALCMHHLMTEASNENLECLCSLITTIGSKVTNDTEVDIKRALKHYLDMLFNLAHNKKMHSEFELESRIRFKILDTIDLSRRNWRPRMVENNPKKLEELREEAKQEEAVMHKHNHSKNSMKNEDRDRSRRPGNMPYSFTKSGSGSKWP